LEGVGGGVMWRMLLFSQQMFCKGCVFWTTVRFKLQGGRLLLVAQ
jgi:hypothetical protein